MILAYYTSGLTDRSLFNFDNLYLYGGLFDVIAILLGHVLVMSCPATSMRSGICSAPSSAWAALPLPGPPRG